jgi:hypothetical protein
VTVARVPEPGAAGESAGKASLTGPQPARPLRADLATRPMPPLPRIAGGWPTILADPPWRFINRTGKVAPEHRRLDRYDTMPAADIARLPVAEIAADRAHL